MAWDYQNKNATSYDYPTRSSTTLDYKISIGQGWAYNRADFTYNQDKDDYNNNVYYNSAGFPTSWDYQTKS
jgi:hypothetical protein